MRKRSEVLSGKIIDSARDLFISVGYETTTIDKIAMNAKTTKKTLYTYFPDKKTILNTVVKSLVTKSVEPSISEIRHIKTKDDLYKELYIIAKSLNNAFSQDAYLGLLKVVISEVNNHSDLSHALDVGITHISMRKLIMIFEHTNSTALTSVKDVNISSRMFIGGLLTELYLKGLLQPSPCKIAKYTSAELFAYVDEFIPVLFRSAQKIDEEILSVSSRGARYGV